MKTLKLLCLLLCGLISSDHAYSAHLRANILLAARMDGMQENPAVITNALGVATLMLNESMDTLCVSIDWTGTSGPVSGLHFHEGMPGMNGPVVFDLSPFITGNRIRTYLTGNDLAMINLPKLLSGAYYFNAHTAANPNGEIRGQIIPESDYSFPVMANGANENPPVITNASATGFINLSEDKQMLSYYIIMQDLSGNATGAHLHLGSTGINGPVEADLTPGINGNILSGTLMNPTQLLLDSLFMSAVYLNIHTAANPNGEIRAQLMHSWNYLYFDSRLDGLQEVPSVTALAKGAASIRLNTAMDSLWYDVAVDNLSGAITGAHLHNAVLGANGPVIIDLTASVNAFMISGVLTGPSLNQTLITEMLEGNIYINIHTAANPNGEVRGQVYRLLREGYTVSMEGDQEVPSVSTSATGGGMVSVSREQQNLHVMLVASGLNANGAHFHHNIAGQNGPVIFDLTPWLMNDGIFGYWTSMDATPFDITQSIRFRNDSVYVNLHTSANPNGEIRGQVLRGFKCSPVITSIDDHSLNEFINVFPNPVANDLNISFDSNYSGDRKVLITDISGRAINFTTAGSDDFNVKINTADWQSGVYLIRIDNYGHKIVRQ